MANNPKENAPETPVGTRVSRRRAIGLWARVVALAAGAGVLAQPDASAAAGRAPSKTSGEQSKNSTLFDPKPAVYDSAASNAEDQVGLPAGKEGVLPTGEVLQFETVGDKVVWLEEDGGLYAANFDQETNVWSEKVVLVQPLSPENNPSRILSFDVFPSSDGQHGIVLKTSVTAEPERTEIKYVRSDLSGKIGLMEIVTDFDRVNGTFNVKEVVASSTAEGSPIVVFTASPDGAWHSLYYAQRVVKPENSGSDAGNFDNYLKEKIRAEVIAQFMQVKDPDKLKARLTQIITKVTKENSESVSKYASLSIGDFADKLIESGIVGYTLSENGDYAWTYLPFFADMSNVDIISVGTKLPDSTVPVSYHHHMSVSDETSVETTTLDTITSDTAPTSDPPEEAAPVTRDSDFILQARLPANDHQEPESNQLLQIFGVDGQVRDIKQTVTEVVGPDVVVVASLGSEKKVAIIWTFDGEDKDGNTVRMRFLPQEHLFDEEVVDVSVASSVTSNKEEAELVAMVTLKSGKLMQLSVERSSSGLKIEDSKIEGLISQKSHIQHIHDKKYQLTVATSEGMVQKVVEFVTAQLYLPYISDAEPMKKHNFV